MLIFVTQNSHVCVQNTQTCPKHRNKYNKITSHVLEQNKLEPLKGQICNTFKVFDSKMLEFYLKIFDTLKQ